MFYGAACNRNEGTKHSRLRDLCALTVRARPQSFLEYLLFLNIFPELSHAKVFPLQNIVFTTSMHHGAGSAHNAIDR
jgi:hypothetical protein